MMKKQILISIKPEFVEKILSGSKKYEFRKKAAKSDVSSLIIYETTPVMKVVAEAEIEALISGTPEEVWAITAKDSGITKEYFDKYFSGRSIAYAYKLKNVTKYKTPIELSKLGISFPPQSFMYFSKDYK